MRPTVLEIDKKKFLKNIEKIKKYIGNKEIMPIIKANGYGTYINKDLNLLNKFNIVGVALVSEALELRELGSSGRKRCADGNSSGISEIF